MSNISILILTKNEEQDLPGCLESVSWSNDILIIDSASTDNTEAIGRSFGARVLTNEFTGYASQRNFGLSQDFRNSWVLILDADERVSDELRIGLLEFTGAAGEALSAGRIRRRDIWWGTWLRHAQISPFFVRLVRPKKVRYEREINEQLVVDGTVGEVEGLLDHYPFSKGLSHWIDKHNRYAYMEARVLVEKLSVRPDIRIILFGRDFNERRVHQKALFYRLPGRPILKFFYMLVFRRAFLDGIAGMRYTILQCIYEYFIVLYSVELRKSAASLK